MSKAARTRLPGVRRAYASAWPSRDRRSLASSRSAHVAQERVDPAPVLPPADRWPPPERFQASRSVDPDIAARLLQHGLHLQLRGSQPLAGGPEPGNSLLEQRQCGVELHVFGLELSDDLLQSRQLLGQGPGGGGHQLSSSSLHSGPHFAVRHPQPERSRPRRIARRLSTRPSSSSGDRVATAEHPERAQGIELRREPVAAGFAGARATAPDAACSRSPVRASRSPASRVRPVSPAASRTERSSTRRSTSRRSATASSAAAEGVAARISATRSVSEMSVSCPTAEIVGTRTSASARHTASLLKAARSSRASAAASDDAEIQARNPIHQAQGTAPAPPRRHRPAPGRRARGCGRRASASGSR